jgi:hypothetical protein
MSHRGPTTLRFYGTGGQEFIAIEGSFPNGRQFDVSDSSYLKLVSDNPHVVSLSEGGTVTAIGPGNASVTATYELNGQTLRISVPASVTAQGSHLEPNPPALDFGDQPVGTASSPREIVLTNRSRSTITIYKLEIRAEVKESDDCTAVPLPPGGTCTISVTYIPYRAGRRQGLIYIPNSQSGQISLPISGNGI